MTRSYKTTCGSKWHFGSRIRELQWQESIFTTMARQRIGKLVLVKRADEMLALDYHRQGPLSIARSLPSFLGID